MKKLIIFALLAGLSACTNNPNPEVVSRQASVVSSGDGNFGSVVYGQNPIKSFVFKNNGSDTISGPPILIGSGFDLALQLGCESIASGKSCLVKVIFQSATKESGNYNASLKVGDATVNLSASIPSVPSPSYEFSVNGESVGAGGLSVGELSGKNIKLMTIKIKNNSPKVGQQSSIALSNSRYRTLQTTCSSIVLKPNQSCTVKVVVQGDNTNGTVATQLSFDGQTRDISATQVEQILTGEMISVNSSITLGDFYTEGVNKIQILKIENKGNGVGNVESSSITLPPGYLIMYNNCSNVKPLGSCVIRLVYSSTEQDKGSHTQTVTVGDGDVDLTVNQVTNPNKLSVLDVQVLSDIAVGTCSPVQVLVKDDEGLDFVSSQSLVLQSNESLYGDSNCSVAKSSLEPFESAKTFYIKKTSSGLISLNFSLNALSVTKSIFWFSPLNISSSKSVLVINTLSELTVTGGKSPFTYSVTGPGAVENNQFSAAQSGNATIKVVDSLNHEATVSINVVDVLSLSSQKINQIVNTQQTITADGGLSPYTYTVSAGSGVINSSSGLFTAAATAGSVTLKVTDNSGQMAQVSVNVVPVLTVTPLTISLLIEGQSSIAGVGGLTPYSYSIVSGGGSINSATGSFTARNTSGSMTLRVTDSLNQTADAIISVASNITVSLGTCDSSIPEQVDCTVSSTGGIGSKTYSVNKGFINATTGVFYGQCEDNVGQSTVTATDSMGNTGTVNLTYPCVHKTCSQLRAQQKGLVSGDYWLDPDGVFKGGTTSPFKVYCDFRTTGTFALMADKKGVDGIYFPPSTAHLGRLLGFYNYGPSASGTFSLDLKNFATIPSAVIRLEDGIYNYVMTWDGLNTFKYVSSANLSTNPPGKIWTLNNTGFLAPAVGTTLLYDVRALNTGATEDQCGMIERNGTNPHAGITQFYFASLNPASGWSTIGSQNWCPYGLGAHGDYNFDGYAWQGGYRTGNGTAIKIYYQDIYYHHPTSCNDAKQKGAKNLAGNTGSGTYTIDTDGYLYGSNPVDVNCDMETDQYGWQEVSSANLSSTKMLQGKQFVKIGSYISTTGVASGVQVIGIFGNAVKSQNFLVGKPTLNTTATYSTHSTPARGYNYMGGHRWFINNNISSGSLDYAIVFSNGIVGSILTSSDGQTAGSEHAYVYYYRHNYSLWERP